MAVSKLVNVLQMEEPELWEAPRLLKADVLEAAAQLSPEDARYITDLYYSLQHYRIEAGNQHRSQRQDAEPNRLTDWFQERFHQLEKQIQRVADAYSQVSVRGQWLRRQTGVGPVLAAALLAHLDTNPPATVGHWYRYCGLDPDVVWLGAKGAEDLIKKAIAQGHTEPEAALAYCAVATKRRTELLRKGALVTAGTIDKKGGTFTMGDLQRTLAKRPWNARLKVVCWKLSESFVKQGNRPDCFYGHLYQQRKALEIQKNGEGAYQDEARRAMEHKRIGTGTFASLWYRGALPLEAVDLYYEAAASATEARKRVAGAKKIGSTASQEDRDHPTAETVIRALAEQTPTGAGVPMLPPDHIQSRAQRWAVKIFLSHYHLIAYWDAYGKLPPKPFALEAGHAHFYWPPHIEGMPGLVRALMRLYPAGR